MSRNSRSSSLAENMLPPGGAATTPRHSTDYSASARRSDPKSLTQLVGTPSAQDTKEDHRKRHLSEAEISLTEDKDVTRDTLASVNQNDRDLYHLQPAHVLEKDLGTNFQNGLTSAEAAKRLATDGPNKLAEGKPPSIFIIFILQFMNIIIFLLIIAGAASFAIGHTPEGVAIYLIILLNATIATWQERSAASALDALAKMSSPQCVVVRDGKQQQVASEDLVRGDMVTLVTGDVVPADVRLINSADLKVNEMLLTGEPDDVAKKWDADVSKSKKLTADNMAFSSCTVSAGNALTVVVETGMNTRVGKIAKLLKGEETDEKKGFCTCLDEYKPKMTPLQHALHRLGMLMGTIAMSVCILVWVVGTVRGTVNPQYPHREIWLDMLMVAVSLAVSAIPEGLPMVVTICLSKGTSDMVKKNVLVRKLAAVETLGSASVICTDKTGTLTEGKMTALKIWGDFKEYEITGKGFVPEGEILYEGESQVAPGSGNVQIRAMLTMAVLCSNTKLQQEEVEGHVKWVPLGNSSEAPLIVLAAKAGIWEDYIASEYERVGEIPFSSSRKMMVTLNKTPRSVVDNLKLPSGTNYISCVKGAPNYILNNAEQYLKTDGSFETMTPEDKEEILEAVDELSSQALRVLAIAFQPLKDIPYGPDCDDTEEKFRGLAKPLVLAGLVASIDPERDGVKEAVRVCRDAGVSVKMITGDYLKTAIAIAKNIDLLTINSDPDQEATDCQTLRPNGNDYLTEPELDEITSRTSVFARAKPEDKIEIVKSLQRQQQVSAMTGDGVNDAPALKEADIGVAMGITGTEVAKGASDMILTDDNFVSIVAAVEKGRIIYENIQKFVVFLLSTNMGEIGLMFTAVAIGAPAPLYPLQILVLNLLSDGMPAVALSLEKGDGTVMSQTPRPKSQPILHGRLWKYVGFNAVAIFISSFGSFVTAMYLNTGALLQNDLIDTDAIKAGDACDDNDNAPGCYYTTCNYFTLEGWEVAGCCDCGNGETYATCSRNCAGDGIAAARTMTFITLTMAEVGRAFTVRSFEEHMFTKFFENKFMWGAAFASVVLTVALTNIPWLYDYIMGFYKIQWWKWLIAISFSFNTVFWAEMLKVYYRAQRSTMRRWRHLDDQFALVLLEVRNLRHHVENVEHSMQSSKGQDHGHHRTPKKH